MIGKRSCLLWLIIILFSFNDLFPQAATISGWRHPDFLYCSTEGGDSLIGASPSGKSFYLDDTSYITSHALVRTADGNAIFYPDRAGVGTHTIIYGNIGSHDVTVIVTIQAKPAITLAPFGNNCSTAPSFSLFSADSGNVSPKTGRFSGPGVDASGNFNPAVAGPGIHAITYTAGIGSCQSSVTRMLNVIAAPVTGINAFPPVCEDTGPFLLSQGYPAGGSYTGPGVDISGRFDQSVTGIGSFPITYTYSNGTCTNTSTRNINVAAKPAASFSGLGNLYCPDDVGVNLTGNPASVTGSFTGPGITDSGNGTALFEPVQAGLGSHQISYIYTSPEGCADTAVHQVQIGTNVIISGLAPKYCINSADVTVSSIPLGGSYSAIAGLTDHGDGTAVFSPASAGAGIQTISYTYIDGNGCINTRSVVVTVYALPDPSIPDLAASYCANNPSLILKGNYMPLGTFSGPSVTDNGNGTAGYNPSGLLPGNSYPVIYSYRDPVTGCLASVTNQVLINALPSATLSGNAEICYGNDANLLVALSGSGPFSISLTEISGTYTINNIPGPVYNTQVFPVDTITYTLTDVTDNKGCRTSGNGIATIKVLPEVTIISQPLSQRACPGSNIIFSLNATGVNLQFQWEKDGVPIAGETNATIALNNIQPGDIGTYRCSITGDCGIPVTSNEALLELWSPVQLIADPAGVYECEGSNVELHIQAIGSGLSYQWYRNNIALKDTLGYLGTATPNLFINSALALHAGNYHVTVSGQCGTVNSNPAIVKVDRNILINNHPIDVQICEGFNAVFQVSVSGDNISYQWQLNGVNLPGETGNVLTVPNCSGADEGFYSCLIRSGCGSESMSNAAHLEVIRKPLISTNPVNLLHCEGDNAVFKITATGSSITYQWKKDGIDLADNARISGSTDRFLTITNVNGSDIGAYTCSVLNTCDSISSTPATLSVDTSLAVISQPVSIHDCLNKNAFFSVSASGNNLSYQWFKDGILLPGQTGTVLALNNITSGDGAEYYCKISNSCGRNVTSNTATLYVDANVAITGSPVDMQICEGDNAIFSVNASGHEIKYQWEYNGVAMSDIDNISGTGTGTLLISSAGKPDQGVYNCLVQGSCGSQRSVPASLIVGDTLIINEQPENVTICEGNNAQFSISATGAIHYQWQKDESDIPGETGESLTIEDVSTADSGVYRCIVYSLCDTLATDGASLTVKLPPQVTQQPVPVNSCEDLQVHFESKATGSDLLWDWSKDGLSLGDGNGVTGSGSPSLIIDSVRIIHAGIYSATVTGYCGTITTNPALLSVISSPEIVQQPQPVEVCENQTSSFSFIVNGDVVYQWQRNNIDLAGENDETLILTNIASSDAGIYRCRITDLCGDLYSEGALLTVNQNPVIIDQPVDITECEGNGVTLRIAATGTNLTYQWYRDGSLLSNDVFINGSQSPVLTIQNIEPVHAGLYYCEVTATCGTVKSDAALVTVNEPVIITEQPVSVKRCTGLAATFRIQATGSNITYQWQKDGADIPGANDVIYNITAVSPDDTGIYRCIISGACGQVLSEEARLTVDIPPVVTSQPPASVHICSGNLLSAGVSAQGSGLSYQWYHNGAGLADGSIINGLNSTFFTIDPVTSVHEGIYYCEISNSCSQTVTNGMQVWIDEPIVIQDQPQSSSSCTGNPIILSISAAGDNLTYQWEKNGSSIAGAIDPVYIINNAALTDSGAYQCIISSSCGDVISNGVQVNVYDPLVILTSPPAVVSQCEGTDVLLNVIVSGSTLSYHWKRNGISLANGGKISGSQSPTLRISGISTTDQGIYTCEITGNCNKVTTSVTAVEVNAKPSIIFDPSDYSVLSGGNASFSATVAGDITTYQWYFNSLALTDGGAIAGSNTNILSVSGVTVAHEGAYNIVIGGLCGTASSQPALLSILTTSVITSQPAGALKCEGESVTIFIEASGTGHTYQWKKNGTLLADNIRISGSLQAELSITDLSAADAGSYSCMVDGIENSLPAILNVNRTSRIISIAGENDLCTGESIMIYAQTAGDLLSYSWYKDGTLLSDNASVSGSSSETIIINPVNTSYSGSYTCHVTGACGTATSDPLAITVADPVIITKQPVDTTVCEDQPVFLSASATGSAITWQWYKNGSIIADNAHLSGTQTHTLLISDTDINDDGIYYCIAQGPCNQGVYTNSAAIHVNRNVNITLQPENEAKCAGDLAVFSLGTNLSNVQYQWQKDGNDLSDDAFITGSNTNILRISNIQLTDMGIYRCIVTGSCNSVSSNPVSLGVSGKTMIQTHPLGGIICEGSTFSCSVTATGSSLVYQWIKDGVPLSDGGRYSGTHSPLFIIDSATPDDAGAYHCIVSGICGTEVSNYAVLEINRTTSIITQPLASLICEGNDLVISVFATGSALGLQWQKDNVSLIEGGHYSGTGSMNLNILNATHAESGIYRCIVTGVCGTVISNTPQVTVLSPPSLLVQPSDTSLCEGSNLLLKTVATGDEILFNWKMNGVPTGSSSDELFIPNIATADEGIYTCTVSNTCGSVDSDAARLIVNQHGNILSGPADKSACLANQVIFSIDAGGGNLEFRWEFNGIPMSDGLRIAGSSSRSLVITNIDMADQGIYRCIVTDACSNVINSEPAVLTVNEPVKIKSISLGDTICEGQSASLSIDATGSNLTFRWYRNGILINDGEGISGSNTSLLNIENSLISNSGYYSCRITGSCGDVTTSPIPLLVTQPITITKQPDNLMRCTGDNAVFSVTALGDSLTYQWIKDGLLLTDGMGISGSNASLLLITNLNSASSGSYYCAIRNRCGISNSQTASLTVKNYPGPAGIITGENLVCEGSEGYIYSVVAIGDADSYRWTLPSGIEIISGRDTRQIEVDFNLHEAGGPVYVQGINSCGTGPSSPVLNIAVNPLPVVNAGESTGVCSNETMLSAFDPGLPSTGLWRVISGPAIIDQPSQAITEVTGLRNGENKFEWTVTLNGCSLSDTLTIHNNMLHVDAGKDTSICSHIYLLDAVSPVVGVGKWSIVSGAGYNIDRYNPKSMVSGLAKGANIFKWSVNNNGCTSYDTVKITSNLPTEADAGNDQVLQSDNTNLSANVPEIGSGAWTLLNGSAIISNPAKNNTQVSGLGQGQNIFEWTILHMGCISSDTVVIINSVTDSTEAGPNQVICSNSSRLNAKNPYPGYGEWSVKRGAATFANNSQYNTYAYNLSQGENVLVWTQYLNGITSDSVIIINNLPTTANAGMNISVCFDSVELNANLPYIGTGSWTIVSGAGVFENVVSNIANVRNLARGRNDFKWTITNGNCTSSSVVSVNNNRPTDAEAGFDVTICEDTIVLNPNIPTFGKREWSVSTGSAKFNGNIAYDLGRDDNKLIYTIRNYGCYSRDTIVITSHKPTQARLGPDQSVCRDSLKINANVPLTGSGIWSLQSGSASIGDLNEPSAIAENIGPGENIFRWTISYLECTSFDEMIISNDLVLSDAGGDQVLCADRTILEANDPGYSTGIWTVIGGSTGASILNPFASNSVVENLAPGVNILRWTISKNACESHDEVVITNNSPTVAFAGENSYLCVDEVRLRANPITIGTGSWSVLSGSGSLDDYHDPLSTVHDLATGINVLRWTTENAGCVSTDEVIISNNLPVNVYAGMDQDLCDDSTVLYANPPVIGTGIWSILQGAASFAEPNRYNTNVLKLGNGINRLKWTVSTTGCSVTDTVEIKNNLPTPAVAGSDFPVCNSTGGLNANTPNYGTGSWSLISGAGDIAESGSPRTNIYNLALGINTLQWTIVNGNCYSSDQLVITNNSPTVADAGESAEVCGETAILYANFPVIGTGYWSVVSGTGDFNDSLNYNSTITGLNFGDNTLRWTTKNGDCSTSDEIIITNNLAKVYAGEDQVVYEATSVLSGNNPETGTGRWELAAGSGNLTGAGDFTTQVTELGAGLNTFEWTITKGGCIARDQVVINFKIMPQVGFMASITEGCPGLTVDFVNTTRYGTTYKWNMGDGTVTNEVNPRHSFDYADKFIVRLTAFGPDNQEVIDDTVITIHSKPIADFQFAPDTAIINKPVRFYNGSLAGASTYAWNFDDNEYSMEENPMHYYRKSGNYDITLIVNSDFGCQDTITKTLTVAEDGILIFPNAFTPNPEGPNGGAYNENDFTNNVFHPYYENVAEFHLEIYSRWGVLLFETDEIITGWDGYYKGALLARDVYVWKATGKYVSGTEFLKTGNVLLIK